MKAKYNEIIKNDESLRLLRIVSDQTNKVITS